MLTICSAYGKIAPELSLFLKPSILMKPDYPRTTH